MSFTKKIKQKYKQKQDEAEEEEDNKYTSHTPSHEQHTFLSLCSLPLLISLQFPAEDLVKAQSAPEKQGL